MENYREIEGDLISLTLKGEFDVVTHGCNCMCVMGAGIAPQMAKAFGCHRFEKEWGVHKADVNKLGTIDWEYKEINGVDVAIINSYTQYNYGRNHVDGDLNPLDYEALTLCLRKINKRFKGLRVGLPKIGCGLAGGDWDTVKSIIQKELKDCHITVVNYKK